ncbi:MAG: nitroreductase/quinone reductase family protein [Ilumatobacteraceae bacterium]
MLPLWHQWKEPTYQTLKAGFANPSEVLIHDEPTPFRVTAREVTGDERALWWACAIAAFPGYIERQAKTSQVFPVLVASPQ